METIERATAPVGVNAAQTILLNTYPSRELLGELQHRPSDGALTAAECGDGLFAFLFSELSDGEGCNTMAEAAKRVATAISDLQVIGQALNPTVTRDDGWDRWAAQDALLNRAMERCQFYTALQQLLVDAKELRAIKLKSFGVYTEDDIRTWEQRLTATEDWLREAGPFFPRMVQHIEDRAAAIAGSKERERGNYARGISDIFDLHPLDPQGAPAIAHEMLSRIESLAVLSTAHLSAATRAKLINSELSVHAYEDEYGCFIHVGEWGDAMPDEIDLAPIILIARRANLVWLRFDRDAALIPDLKTYD